ncbi:hypothetical protein VE02_04263 [Pseudogymnoascus sp. 03VT05]|nr:hypothetical protein VE02_04263 [Pseudogymnoascus sp. 03VT05]
MTITPIDQVERVRRFPVSSRADETWIVLKLIQKFSGSRTHKIHTAARWSVREPIDF